MAMLCLLGVLLILAQTLQESVSSEPEIKNIVAELLHKVASLEMKVQQQAKELQHQSEAFDALQAQVHQLEERRNDAVAFAATLISNTGFPVGEAVKFDRVLTNTGGVYSAETGLFTAPANGYYFFSVSPLKCNDDFRKVTLRMNGVEMAVIVTDKESITPSASTVGYLEAGQTAYIHSEDASGGACLYGENHSTFSGFLVSI